MARNLCKGHVTLETLNYQFRVSCMYVYLFKFDRVCIDMYLILFVYFRVYLIFVKNQLNFLIFILHVIIDINRNYFLLNYQIRVVLCG